VGFWGFGMCLAINLNDCIELLIIIISHKNDAKLQAQQAHLAPLFAVVLLNHSLYRAPIASKGALKRKITPSSPLKMPKLKENEVIIGFRPYGNTSFCKASQMFQLPLPRINEKRKFKLVTLGVILFSRYSAYS